MLKKLYIELEIVNKIIEVLKTEIIDERKIQNPDKEDMYELGKLQGEKSSLLETKTMLLDIINFG